MRHQSWWHVVTANSASTGNEWAVMMVLSLHANARGYVGIPRAMLAELSRLSEQEVRTSLKKLIRAGELYHYSQGRGNGRHNVYQITVLWTKVVDTKSYRIGLIELPPPTEFPPLRVLELPESSGENPP